jgi:uncharacterized membrane protein
MRAPGRLDRERARRAFWLPSALLVPTAVALAYGLRAVDGGIDLPLGLFAFNDLASARSVLTTIASVTVSVAGLSFSVTLVALQLASSQLSPRVLTTFREDLIAQLTLAAFLSVFAFAITLLGRLTAGDARVPETSLVVAMLAVFGAFGLFVAFIGRVIAGLQASTVIRRIASDGRRAIGSRHPRRAGRPAEDGEAARRRVLELVAIGRRLELRARESGFVLGFDAEALVADAVEHDALVVQRAQVGDLVVRGQPVADAFLADASGEDITALLERHVRYGPERTLATDVAFPIRSLADVALRALSPSLNDPTTAENAMGAVCDLLVRVLEQGEPERLRLDERGAPRLLALAPDLDDLVRLGFEQVRAMVVDGQPVLAARLVVWLEELERIAQRGDAPTGEIRRQLTALAASADRRDGADPA